MTFCFWAGKKPITFLPWLSCHVFCCCASCHFGQCHFRFEKREVYLSVSTVQKKNPPPRDIQVCAYYGNCIVCACAISCGCLASVLGSHNDPDWCRSNREKPCCAGLRSLWHELCGEWWSNHPWAQNGVWKHSGIESLRLNYWNLYQKFKYTMFNGKSDFFGEDICTFGSSSLPTSLAVVPLLCGFSESWGLWSHVEIVVKLTPARTYWNYIYIYILVVKIFIYIYIYLGCQRWYGGQGNMADSRTKLKQMPGS